jgi:hypothetical protein
MADDDAPASLRSLGSADDKAHDAAGTIPPAHDWVRSHVNLSEDNKVTLTAETVDTAEPYSRDAIHNASRAAGHDPSTRIIGSVARRRTDPDGWGYSCTDQDPLVDGSRMYTTALTAAYACAIHVVATRFERQRFDATQPLPVPPARHGEVPRSSAS